MEGEGEGEVKGSHGGSWSDREEGAPRGVEVRRCGAGGGGRRGCWRFVVVGEVEGVEL